MLYGKVWAFLKAISVLDLIWLETQVLYPTSLQILNERTWSIKVLVGAVVLNVLVPLNTFVLGYSSVREWRGQTPQYRPYLLVLYGAGATFFAFMAWDVGWFVALIALANFRECILPKLYSWSNTSRN